MKYKIIVDKQSRSNPTSEKKEYEIDIEELRAKGNVYDSLIFKIDGTYVMRRLHLSELQVLTVLEEPIKEPLENVNIELFDGDNYIYLIDMEGNRFYAEYLIRNEFNEVFATRKEMNTAINLTMQEIDLAVNQKLTNYSTTEEMNALIQLLSNQINLELQKKVDGDTITGAYLLLKINNDTSEAKIKADKVNLSGYVTIDNLKTAGQTTIDGSNITTGTIDATKVAVKNLNADNITSGTITGRAISGGTITGTKITNGNNFNVDTNGNMSCNNGTFNGGNVNLTDDGLGAYEGKLKIQGSGFINGSYSEGIVVRKIGSTTNSVSNQSIFLIMYEGEPQFSMQGSSREITSIKESGMSFNFKNDVAFNVNGTNKQAGLYSITNFYVDGGITTPVLTQTSLETIKKNIEKANINALELIKNADIYEYNLKSEEDTDKKHIGFIIGEKYNTPQEVIAKSGEGIDTYTMTSILWKAVQEQQEQIENQNNLIQSLIERIEKLEAK